MLQKLKTFTYDIITNVLSSMIAAVLLGLSATVILVWSSFKTIIEKMEGNNVPFWHWLLLGISLVVALICIIVHIIYIVKRYNCPNFPKLVPDLKIEDGKYELYFKDRENILCYRESHLEIVCEKKDSIDNKYTWTGSEYNGTILEDSNGEYTLEDNQRKRPPHGYVIKFNTTKYRGDKVYYKTKTTVTDADHEMRPYLRHTVKSPTKMLELRVTVPRGLIRNVKFTVYADMTGEIPITKPQYVPVKHIGDLDTFCHVEENTNLLYNYEISWDFS